MSCLIKVKCIDREFPLITPSQFKKWLNTFCHYSHHVILYLYFSRKMFINSPSSSLSKAQSCQQKSQKNYQNSGQIIRFLKIYTDFQIVFPSKNSEKHFLKSVQPASPKFCQDLFRYTVGNPLSVRSGNQMVKTCPITLVRHQWIIRPFSYWTFCPLTKW